MESGEGVAQDVRASPACQSSHARRVDSGSTAGLTGCAPVWSVRLIRSAKGTARSGKHVLSKSSDAIISGMPPMSLVKNGTFAPRHSSTVFGKLSTMDGMTARTDSSARYFIAPDWSRSEIVFHFQGQ